MNHTKTIFCLFAGHGLDMNQIIYLCQSSATPTYDRRESVRTEACIFE